MRFTALLALIGVVGMGSGARVAAQTDSAGIRAFSRNSAQQLAEDPLELKSWYPSLQEYLAFVDGSYASGLSGLSEEKRAAKADELKQRAGKDYTRFRREYEQSCRDMADFLGDFLKEGYQIEVLAASGQPDAEDKSVYRMVCTLSLVHTEDRQVLRLGYLAINTPSGWRVLDGFFENPRS